MAFNLKEAIKMIHGYEKKMGRQMFYKSDGMAMTAIHCYSALENPKEKLEFALEFRLYCNQKFVDSNNRAWKQRWEAAYIQFYGFASNGEFPEKFMEVSEHAFELQNSPITVDCSEVDYDELIGLLGI